MLKKLVRFLNREDGPTSIEYAVMLGLIIAVCVAAITITGKSTKQSFSNASLAAAAS
jgi:pilus assembly protein Flp/PilA